MTYPRVVCISLLMPTYEFYLVTYRKNTDHGIRANILLSVHLIKSSVPSKDTHQCIHNAGKLEIFLI